MADHNEPDLSAAEKEALHDIQHATEHLYQGFGNLIAFHHKTGRAMDKLAQAEETLRKAGHEEYADELREKHLPSGAVDDMWTYEVVDTFRHGFLPEITEFDDRIRRDIADGHHHITESEQQEEWRDRVDWEP
ncbi:hypothetical protein halTADL_2823 [Halohasta litchfieldiae]|jgi:hypothetical protein|uniref:Uncharacterized protein n=1 Tax=Halohasta litchfieldiae TaxID=1073996 RepID=A0A1H6W422_9EURY|nr:hypothetical protein [Halohasta litchfieldiae]ATW89535.1 hypothetical protein halTADL_2823 [Halohasta litchfieldiae]SEJ11698.1 hypothetical protein SAMN05444271_12236 [Halohasta litchfieldiae]